MISDISRTILLVEDEAIISIAQKTTLEKYGYNVISVDSGEKAVDKVQQLPGIDLILMDIDLGTGLDGTETASIILEDRDIPIVFLSSHTEPEIVEKTEKITSYGYVVKSSSITVLDASIKMAFKLFEAKINEGKKEESLAFTRNLLKTAFDSSLDSLFIFKASRDDSGQIDDFIFQDLNINAEKMIQIDRESLIGKKMCDILPVNRDTGFFEKYKRVIETGVPLVEEFYLPETNVPEGWHYHQVTPIENGIFISHREITESRKIEQMNIAMANMLDLAPNSITVHDNTGHFIYANQKTFELHGYNKEEFMKINLHELDVPESEEKLSERFKTIFENEEASFEVGHFHKDGSTFPLLVYGRKVDWLGIPAVLSIATDITELKNAEKTIDEQKKYLETIINTTADGFWIVDSRKRITMANAAYCRMSGYSKDELEQLFINDVDEEENPENTNTRVDRIIKNGFEIFETTHRRKDGSTFPVEISSSYLNIDGGQFICFCRDITARKTGETG